VLVDHQRRGLRSPGDPHLSVVTDRRGLWSARALAAPARRRDRRAGAGRVGAGAVGQALAVGMSGAARKSAQGDFRRNSGTLTATSSRLSATSSRVLHCLAIPVGCKRGRAVGVVSSGVRSSGSSRIGCSPHQRRCYGTCSVWRRQKALRWNQRWNQRWSEVGGA
jgi:hypothetical protein